MKHNIHFEFDREGGLRVKFDLIEEVILAALQNALPNTYQAIQKDKWSHYLSFSLLAPAKGIQATDTEFPIVLPPHNLKPEYDRLICIMVDETPILEAEIPLLNLSKTVVEGLRKYLRDHFAVGPVEWERFHSTLNWEQIENICNSYPREDAFSMNWRDDGWEVQGGTMVPRD